MIHEAQEVLEFNTFVREKLATFYARSQSSIPHNSLLFKRRSEARSYIEYVLNDKRFSGMLNTSSGSNSGTTSGTNSDSGHGGTNTGRNTPNHDKQNNQQNEKSTSDKSSRSNSEGQSDE